ncbi:MgtC/SapB family protein [Thalassobaculum sp. OXR-137]|uniref:MgtC/SapB family protein n=1 Tax=Thalassobaculum sp. OXR-137 TaxID=3100173 RepID=UPI002AC9B805|nr:MgtC/SapB family protein [Thalassobaculum sp. OXR-137]WPZ32287.1 MgtC/SapB family protein [Thalassobaculum sp. OXR-137]
MQDLLPTLDQLAGSDTAMYAERLGLALLLGMVIGVDRELRRKPAGLRSHMLVSLASAAFALIALELVDSVSAWDDHVRIDPTRVLEAVVTGIAFLGAGAIIRNKGEVEGITTGASLWLTGALGVACGVGELYLAGMTAILGVIVLVVIGFMERRAERRRESADGG